MYSGSDSTGSQNYNQWPLNPSAYQNTPNEQIDWAALAQQWIIMKEAGPPVPEQVLASAPLQNAGKNKKDGQLEGGEAPMDVEIDKDDSQTQWNDSASTEGSWNWNQQQHWNWSNTWPPPAGVQPAGASKAPLLPTPPSCSQYSSSNNEPANFGSYNRSSSTEFSGGYWTIGNNKIKPHNKRYSKVNVPPRPPITTVSSDPVMLDANKRKQLPAWIREGLEKMERDKQKQLEREREKLEKEELLEKSKLMNEKEALEIIKSTVKERERSRFDSDGEDSDTQNSISEKVDKQVESTLLTQDELMLKVRRTMTEILLKVTNQEIRAVCKEEFQRFLRKNQASDLRISASSGTNISAKLGLGIYGGDSASNSGDSDEESEQNRNDSDTELKNIIKRRKSEFSKTEREIEERLAAAERHGDEDSVSGTPKPDDSDSQVDAKLQGNKIRPNEDVTPPRRFKSHGRSTSSSARSDSDCDRHSGLRDKRTTRKKSSSLESIHDQRVKIRNKRYCSTRDNRSTSCERKRIKEKDRKLKHTDIHFNLKSNSSRSKRSRSKSIETIKKKRSNSIDRYHRNFHSKRSHSRSSSRSRSPKSYTRLRRSESRGRRSRSYTKSEKLRRSRSHTRSERSRKSRSRTRSERSLKSRSRERHSRSTHHSRRSHSRHRSRSYSPVTRSRRRLKSRSSSRGKRSHRH